MTDGIRLLLERQTPDCTVNIHLLGHSTGAYVIREAFDDADDTAFPNDAWSVSQIVFIAGDVSSGSMSAGNSATDSLYRHCCRQTIYFSKHDSALKLSNAKRLGVSPRVGRVGLPTDAHRKAVDVDCSAYFKLLNGDPAVFQADQPVAHGAFDHSWHIGNKAFAADLFETLKGDLDRFAIPARIENQDGVLELTRSNGQPGGSGTVPAPPRL